MKPGHRAAGGQLRTPGCFSTAENLIFAPINRRAALLWGISKPGSIPASRLPPEPQFIGLAFAPHNVLA